MSQTENKVKFGLKNVYYAVAAIDEDGAATYETPVRIPGARNLSMEPQGELTRWAADDNMDYYVINNNNGYQGDLEMARFNDSFMTDVLSQFEGKNGMIYEEKGAEAVHFALLFEFDGDLNKTRHILYNCTATRVAVSGATKEENAEPQTETVTITAGSIYVESLEKDIVKGSCKESDNAYEDFFEAVVMPEAKPTNP